jgi:hypothetical protein
LDLHLEQLLDSVLHNLPPLLHTAGKGGQWLFQLGLHLGGNILVLLCHGLKLAANGVERDFEAAHLLRSQ